MIIALTSTAISLQEPQHKTIEKNQNRTVLSTEPLSTSNHAPSGFLQLWHEQIVSFLLKHFLGFDLRFNTIIMDGVEREVCGLKHSLCRNTRTWTDCAKLVPSDKIELNDSNIILPFINFLSIS